MSVDKRETTISKIVTSVLLLLTLSLGCDSNAKLDGIAIRETGYLECDLRPDQCADDQIACENAEGDTACVDRPTDCSELTCECLADVVCDADALCEVTDSTASLVCTSDPGTWEPCGDKACGDDCTVCDPNDSSCVETDELKSCNSQGQCVAAADDLCSAYDPCQGLTCGDTCRECDPADSECVETAVEKACNKKGQCEAAADDQCIEYDPCNGKSCGEACNLCDPDDSECVETTEVKACDASGTCVPVPDSGKPACDEYDPCDGKTCGDPCTICDPADTDCSEDAVLKACDPNGVCIADHPNVCGEYDPCEGKACGETCLICAPGDPDCMESDVEETCSVRGVCSADDEDMCMAGQNILPVDCSTIDLPADPFDTVNATINGTDLVVDVSFSGGCEEHSFAACFGAFQESIPIGVNLNIGHSDPGDPCDSIVSEVLVIDLLPMQREHAALYPQGPAEISIAVTGISPDLIYRY